MYQSLLRDEDGGLSGSRRMVAGFAAGVTEAFVVVTPFEVVKIRLQQQRGLERGELRYKGPVHGAATIVREEGLRGLWSGASPTVLRNGTNQMCLFWAKPNVDKVWSCCCRAARCARVVLLLLLLLRRVFVGRRWAAAPPRARARTPLRKRTHTHTHNPP